MFTYRVTTSGTVEAETLELIEACYQSAAITRTLPARRLIQGPDGTALIGHTVHIIDAAGGATSWPITVLPGVGETINGAASFSIDDAYQAVTFRHIGEGKWAAFVGRSANDPAFANAGSTIIRTPQDRGQDHVNAADWMTPSQLTDLRAGTLVDCTAAIQSAIDWAMYRGDKNGPSGLAIDVPAGCIIISDTLHIGYGNRFKATTFRGAGPKYGGEPAFGGTSFHPTFSDRPAISVNGCRQTLLKDFTIIGLNQQHIVGIFDNLSNASLDAANWIDPALDANADSRWAPYAGIAIDPYVGNKAAQFYPDINYPAFMLPEAQYNRFASSQIRIENVEIQGFVVGILNQVGDSDANSDYLKINKVMCLYNVYPVSVCNTQMRLMHIEDCAFVLNHTNIVTTKHGRQNGKPQFEVDNTEMGLCIKWIDCPNSSLAGFSFRDCYGEGVYSIGNAGTAAASSCPVKFDKCDWSLDLGDIGSPPIMFNYGGHGFVDFDNCTLKSSSGRLNFFAPQGARQYRWVNNNTFTEFGTDELYQKFAVNATLGVTFCGSNNEGLTTDLVAYSSRASNYYNLDTGVTLGIALYTQENIGPRTRCLPVYGKTAMAATYDPGFTYRTQGAASTVAKSALVFDVVGPDVTTTLTGRTTAQFVMLGPDVGDVVWDETSGAIFYVRSRTGTTISMVAQTGIGSDGELLTAMTTAGSLWFLNCRRYTPAHVTMGSTTAASAVMTAVQRDDGDKSFLESEIPAGDSFLVESKVDNFLPSAGILIAASSNAAGTVTASGNFVRTETRKRITLLVRAAAPNV